MRYEITKQRIAGTPIGLLHNKSPLSANYAPDNGNTYHQQQTPDRKPQDCSIETRPWKYLA